MGLLIVSGLSGAGKSQAVHALEDIGYFCIDNLPPTLLCRFIEFSMQNGSEIEKLAVVMDVRGGEEYGGLEEAMEQLKKSGVPFRCLFLDARDEVLERRYKETRRTHPLSIRNRISTEEAIRRERKILRPIAEQADFKIDTSVLSNAQLRDRIITLFTEDVREGMAITVISFGFKYGIPKDSDLVFDVRCLPNPFYIPELKNKTGMDSEVYDYVMEFEESKELERRMESLLEFSLPLYVKEGKSQLLIAVGCTGGKHRSVTFARNLYHFIAAAGYRVSIQHRDVERNV